MATMLHHHNIRFIFTDTLVCLLCSYMVLFLKFIASVVPTIEYDFTTSAGGW